MRTRTGPGIVAMAMAVAMQTGVAYAADYGMADLQALEKQGSWEELVQHLSDIPPSKRDANWTGLAERSSAAYIGTIPITDEQPETAFGAIDKLLVRFPQLKQSKVFMAKRAEVGLKAFRFSYGRYRHSAGDDPWLDQVKAFVAADSVNQDLPGRAGELVTSRLVAQCAWPLFKTQLDRSGAAFCKNAEFKKSIVAAFVDGVWKDQIMDVADNKCWSDVKDGLLAELEGTPSKPYKRLVCPLLKKKNALNAADTERCAPPPQQ